MTFKEIVNYRRSVRDYDAQKPLNSEKVKECIRLATLAPNSSNMQIWGFYHIEDKAIIGKLAKACFNQSTATTAQQMVVFVTRRDLYKKRCQQNLDFAKADILKNQPEEKQASRIKRAEGYYGKTLPFLYAHFFGFLGFIRMIIAFFTGLFRPMYREVSNADMRIVAHKSCALAAENFMLAMASEGYDTCPMEGYDSKMVKKILHLPKGAEVNMIISCGIRTKSGVWTERFRVPFEEVYQKL
ncbi:MAG: nitroreductase family protein [Flavobacteriales bacterium]|nr:MAG: nitroreductase family protein [Flavobacteriales bacterium]